MPRPVIRILSDLHFGDHASRVRQLRELRPLLDGVSQLVLNGDTLDTRPGPRPEHTRACRAQVSEFLRQEVPAATLLTGNHDADISPVHHLDLAGGEVFVTHGDIFFDDIVPWSQDAPMIRRLIAEELNRIPPSLHQQLDQRFAAFRRVAGAIPQRHQSERNRLKYALHFLADTVWPPLRLFRVIQAWRRAPACAVEATRRHRPAARFVLCGHTHHPGIWRDPAGPIVINTGSYCRPLGGLAVDVAEDRLTVRRVAPRRGEFHLGAVLAAFPLAAR